MDGCGRRGETAETVEDDTRDLTTANRGHGRRAGGHRVGWRPRWWQLKKEPPAIKGAISILKAMN